MQLSEWLSRHGRTQRGAAEELGVAASTLCRILGGERSPSASLMRRIIAMTNGAVTANDLLEIHPADPPEKEAA